MTFHIPSALQEFTGGRRQIEIECPPGSLSDALSALWTVCPGVRDRVLTDQGSIRRHINIFVGNEDSRYTGGLATAVPAGAVIWILPAVSGGLR
jgi:molybdopterin synthase sulfur carrier subunit